MKNWTTQAEQRLTEYLKERADREGFEGEDAAELKEDLRRHIHEEAETFAGNGLGLTQLETILGRLDSGYRPASEMEKNRGMLKNGWGGKAGTFMAWVCGVILPAGILIFEMLSSFCGGVFFDPVPTWWHAVLLAMVPAVNAWLLRGGRGAGDSWRGIAAGFSLVIAVFYGLLFLPIIHLSILALVFFGLGLISLMPILTAFFSWRIGLNARRSATQAGRFRSGWRMGIAAALLALLALEGAPLWTRGNLVFAIDEKDPSPAAISRLRAFHSERSLLKACYEGSRGIAMGTDISGWIIDSWKIPATMMGAENGWGVDSERVRDVFFRVTGKPFNSLKPPRSNRGASLMGRADPLQDMEFDDHLGGDDVAVRLKNLDLAESRFDGHLDEASRIGYGEWTMVFKNRSGQAKEARCQVKLPRDGRVSRLTLWVNGEPREAAFSTVSKVKAAYKSVAVVQRRDPVLVNVVAPDTVMVQCFPVPARGEMKIRFGITAPLDGTRWELPYIIERNFGITDSLNHALWVQGDPDFGLTGSGEDLTASPDGDGNSLQVTLAGEAVLDPGLVVKTAEQAGEPPVVWCEDRFAKPEERYLIREPITVTRPAAGTLVVVIDGSASMAGAKEWICKSLANLSDRKILLVLADDDARRVSLKDLESYKFSGGRYNEAALREGIHLARESGAPVVWIHGPQAIRLSQSEAFTQLLERGSTRPVIIEVEAASGPNRLAEAVFRTGCLKRGPALANPEADFTEFLKRLLTEREENSWNWRVSESSADLPGTGVWDQLARFRVSRAVEDPFAVMADGARAELAARYQLVTPFSGAVVLETQEQYEEHGLTPVDGDAAPQIPSVPEPSSSLLIVLTAAAALMRRRRVS